MDLLTILESMQLVSHRCMPKKIFGAPISLQTISASRDALRHFSLRSLGFQQLTNYYPVYRAWLVYTRDNFAIMHLDTDYTLFKTSRVCTNSIIYEYKAVNINQIFSVHFRMGYFRAAQLCVSCDTAVILLQAK